MYIPTFTSLVLMMLKSISEFDKIYVMKIGFTTFFSKVIEGGGGGVPEKIL
jgi:hypothetical protein